LLDDYPELEPSDIQASGTSGVNVNNAGSASLEPAYNLQGSFSLCLSVVEYG